MLGCIQAAMQQNTITIWHNVYALLYIPCKYTALNLLEIEATKDALRNIFPFVESLTKHFTSFLS